MRSSLVYTRTQQPGPQGPWHSGSTEAVHQLPLHPKAASPTPEGFDLVLGEPCSSMHISLEVCSALALQQLPDSETLGNARLSYIPHSPLPSLCLLRHMRSQCPFAWVRLPTGHSSMPREMPFFFSGPPSIKALRR